MEEWMGEEGGIQLFFSTVFIPFQVQKGEIEKKKEIHYIIGTKQNPQKICISAIKLNEKSL